MAVDQSLANALFGALIVLCEGAVGDRELGSHRKPPPFEVEEELLPRLRALAHAVDESRSLSTPVHLATTTRSGPWRRSSW